MDKNFIGKDVVANIGLDKKWIRYSDSNDGEENYYKDYYEEDTGILCYSDGEICTIEGFNKVKGTVLLSNYNIDLEAFEISYEQCKSDFGIS